MDYRQAYQSWLHDPYFDGATRLELEALAGDARETEDRFYRQLSFGTAGLRGIVAAGTNRMNIYTVRKASQGVADAVNAAARPGGPSGIAIARDTRRMSLEFAREAAAVFAANGIHAYLYEPVMPTPVLSYTVRHLGCAAGVVVTASHNPREYNGYKVYGPDGGQIEDELAREISRRIDAVDPISRARTMDFERAVAEGLITFIGPEVLETYYEKVLGLQGDTPADAKKALRVVYTPLHGTGLVPVTTVLERAGYSGVTPVPRQCTADSEFSTVRSPNPEDPEALRLATELAGELEADLVIATDPDSDRLGVAFRNREGGYTRLTGNEVGCLLLESRLEQAAAAGTLRPDDYAVTTVVTTDMVYAITGRYGIRTEEVLTGFKYIAGVVEKNTRAGRGNFMLGFEESYGYLAGDFVRDKDGVIASLLVCEAAARAKAGGMTLGDRLEGLYERYGYYENHLISHTCRGKDGLRQIGDLMTSLRAHPPASVGELPVTAVRDYETGWRVAADGERRPLNLPVSNVLYFELGQGAWMAVRPSGTEPKIKFYMGVRGRTAAESLALMRTLESHVARMAEF